MPISNGMMNALAIYIRQAFQDAKAFAKTADIEKSIQMEDAHLVNPDRAEASLFVKLKDAPEARAFELGSGIHGSFNTKYQIEAKNVPNLIFWWEREKKIFKGPKLGDPPKLGHPGVKAEPALRPAMINNIDLLRRELKAMVRQQITATIRNSFRQIYRGHP